MVHVRPVDMEALAQEVDGEEVVLLANPCSPAPDDPDKVDEEKSSTTTTCSQPLEATATGSAWPLARTATRPATVLPGPRSSPRSAT